MTHLTIPKTGEPHHAPDAAESCTSTVTSSPPNPLAATHADVATLAPLIAPNGHHAWSEAATEMRRLLGTRTASSGLDPICARDALIDVAHRILLERAWGCRR
jgi:hypothetical protein